MSQNLLEFELGEFNSFINDDFKLISLILTGTIEGDNLDIYSVNYQMWGDYITNLINDELLDEFSMIKKMKKKQRLLHLKNDMMEYKMMLDDGIEFIIEKLDFNNFKYESIMKMFNEFKNLDFKNQSTFILYKSTIEFNNYLDEEKDNISDEEYLHKCNQNLLIIELIKECCNYYLKHKLTSFAIKNFNSP